LIDRTHNPGQPLTRHPAIIEMNIADLRDAIAIERRRQPWHHDGHA
jgi:hypothetical protein